MYRSQTTVCPAPSAGAITPSTSSARAAANSAVSAHGLISTRSSKRRRISSPSNVPPGSRVATTSLPSARRASASRFACVDLPEPSTPSRVTNKAAHTIRAVRAVVTGGAGFIGSHVVDALLARGDEVHVLDDLSSGRRENVAAAAVFHEGDIRDPDAAVAVARPEVVFHLAAQASVIVSVQRPADDADVNVLGTVRILEAAREHGAKLVFASTGGAIYGDVPRPV